MANIKRHDPESLKAAFEAQTDTLEHWCAKTLSGGKPLSYTYTSKMFAKIDRTEEERLIQKAKRLLAKSAPVAAEKLINQMESEDEGIAHKAVVDLLDRTGISKHQPQITIQNDNRTLVMPPLFKEDYTKDVKLFLDAVDAD